MIGQAAVDRMKRRLARFGSSTDLDADILEELKLAQTRLEGSPELPWFLLTEQATIQTTVGESRVPVPTNMLREYEEGALWVEDSEGTEHELRKELWEDIKTDKRFSTSARPLRYALVGSYFRLRPVPDSTYTLRMVYYKQDDEISLSAENLWLKWFPDLVIAEAGQVVASGYLKNKEATELFVRMAERERGRMLVMNEARKHSNLVYVGED